MLYGSPAQSRVLEAVRLRALLRRQRHIPSHHYVAMVAGEMGLHRNSVYRYFLIADANPEKYKVDE